jgi:hypothetical protein
MMLMIRTVNRNQQKSQKKQNKLLPQLLSSPTHSFHDHVTTTPYTSTQTILNLQHTHSSYTHFSSPIFQWWHGKIVSLNIPYPQCVVFLLSKSFPFLSFLVQLMKPAPPSYALMHRFSQHRLFINFFCSCGPCYRSSSLPTQGSPLLCFWLAATSDAHVLHSQWLVVHGVTLTLTC